MRLLSRIYASDKLVPALSVIAILSLILSTYVVVRFAQAQSEREQDRVDSDLWACSRVNILRGQVIDLGLAVDTAIVGILDVVIPDPSGEVERDERIAALEAELAPVLSDLHEATGAIRPVDCLEVVPGSNGRINPTTTEGP